MTTITRLLREAASSESMLKAPAGSSVAAAALNNTRSLMSVIAGRRNAATIDASLRFGPGLVCLDMGVSALIYWLLLGQERVRQGRPIIWKYVAVPGRPAAVLESLLTCIINNTLGFRSLLLSGLGQPLRAVFRNQLELCILAVAITVDEPFCTNYMAWADAPENDLTSWNKVRPKLAMRAIADSMDRGGFTEAERTAFHEWRRGTYAWLSGFEHGHPVSLLVSANSWEADDSGGTSIGGKIDSSLAILLGAATWSFYEFVSLFTGALFRIHGWRGNGAELSDEILLSTRVYLSYARAVMAEQDKRDKK